MSLLYPLRTLLILSILTLATVNQVFSQVGTFQISGKVTDSLSQPLDGAMVILHQLSGLKIVQQGTCAPDGQFTFTIPAGRYLLTVSYIGSKAFHSDTLVIAADKKLAAIILLGAVKNLREVSVKAEKKQPLIQNDGRKLIYNIAKSINAQGTDVLEALKRTPGVSADQNNNLTLNGVNGALVLINGRQTYLQAEELAQLLKSMSSSSIKSIEIIKNPSAEYDAAGTGGIINIITQKSRINGFNGSTNVGVRYGISFKQNTDINFNYRNGKINVFGNYSHNFGNFAMDYNNDRTQNGKTYINPSHDVDKRKSVSSSVGLDYEINDKQSIGFVLNGNFFYGPGIIKPVTYIYDAISDEYLQKLVSTSEFYHQTASRYNANLNYRFQDTLGHTLGFDFDYGIFDGTNKNLNPNTYYSPDGAILSQSIYRTISGKNIDLYAISLNYSTNLGGGKLSAGSKYSRVTADNDFNLFTIVHNTDSIDATRSNAFSYREQISAGYFKYERAISKKLSFDAGLRIENTRSSGNLIPVPGSEQQAEYITRNYTNLFPTGSLTLKTTKSGTYNLSFARRIDRPAYNDLNPFEGRIDELSYWKGNPFLQPQYANTLSLQYSYEKTTAALAFTHVRNLTMPISEIFDGNKVVIQPENIGRQNTINLTVTQQLSLFDWWDATLTAIGYHIKNSVELEQYGVYNPSRFAGTVNAQQTFKLPWKLTAELSGVFNSKTLNGPNGTIKGSSQVDVGFQKNLLQDKATLRLVVTDIYRGAHFDSNNYLNGLLLHGTYSSESRQIRLNFTYKFGSSKLKEQKKHESALQNENQRL
jgi:hypothetical protein